MNELIGDEMIRQRLLNGEDSVALAEEYDLTGQEIEDIEWSPYDADELRAASIGVLKEIGVSE